MKQLDELAVFFRFDIAVSIRLLMFLSTLLFFCVSAPSSFATPWCLLFDSQIGLGGNAACC